MPDQPFTVRTDAASAARTDDLAVLADRLTSMADTAELMGDDAGAARFRDGAAAVRLQAMGLLDD